MNQTIVLWSTKFQFKTLNHAKTVVNCPNFFRFWIGFDCYFPVCQRKNCSKLDFWSLLLHVDELKRHEREKEQQQNIVFILGENSFCNAWIPFARIFARLFVFDLYFALLMLPHYWLLLWSAVDRSKTTTIRRTR